MSIAHQYAGFLDSHLLWVDTGLFGLQQFNIQKPKTTTPTDIPVTIPANEVLGKRIEHFFEYYISLHKNYTLLLKNLQIFKNKITIGELDFLVNDIKQNQILHIEFIYKFYIYDPAIGSTELKRWIGPNRKDSLLEKVTKLKEKQLPLLYHPQTINALSDLSIANTNIKQQVCFMGNLFIPLSYKEKSIPHLNKDCIVGFWIHSKDFTPEKYNDFLYHIPYKKDWIVAPKHCQTWETYTTILTQLKTHLSKKKSPLVWIKTKEDSFAKCFVVWW